jgi:hypothetical protein
MLERLNFCYLKKEFKKRFSLLATKRLCQLKWSTYGAQAAFELARAGYIVLASMNSFHDGGWRFGTPAFTE